MKIKLGYEIDTGKQVDIPPAHIIVTGITQLSGKTTTLEALIYRSGLKAVAFRTKPGEKSFTQGTEVPPYFKDRSDYEFVKSLIEAYAKEKLFLEKGTLMRLTNECQGKGLVGLKQRVDEIIGEGKLRGIKEEIFTRLQHYLKQIIPQIQYSNLSNTLNLYDGINIVNLERFKEEAQSLIIEATVSEILENRTDTITVIPEAWKFLPQKYNNPCKRATESFIRQGAANRNYIWIDSQDMAGVDKGPLKQISVWILGYQSERNEVKHTLDQINLPKKSKPSTEDIMSLKVGQFFLSTSDGMKKVYVQPAWMDDNTAKAVARGKIKVEDVQKPTSLVPHSKPAAIIETEGGVTKKITPTINEDAIRQEIIELRMDFFNKIQEMQNAQNKTFEELYRIDNKTININVDEIVSKVLQKIPNQSENGVGEVKIIELIRKHAPAGGGATYTIAPIEKLKKDFLEETKQKILADISGLSDNAKRMLKYLEATGKGVKTNELEEKCFFLKHSGTATNKVSEASLALRAITVAEKDMAGFHRSKLRQRIESMLSGHGATEQDMEAVRAHIIMELLK